VILLLKTVCISLGVNAAKVDTYFHFSDKCC
jgi:hypothetical protein